MLGGIGHFAFTAFFVNIVPPYIHMWPHPEQFADIPSALLSMRLVIQVLLIMLIWWSTKPDKKSDEKQNQ